MHGMEQNELIFYVRPHGGFTAKLHAQALENSGSSIPVLVDGPYGGINISQFTDGDRVLIIAGGSGAGWCLPFVEKFVRYGSRSQGTHIDLSNVEKDIPSSSNTGTRSLRLVLATRDTTSRRWFLGAVEEILERYRTSSPAFGVRVQVYLTGKAAGEAVSSQDISEDFMTPNGSSLVADNIEISKGKSYDTVSRSEFEGRPQLPIIVKEEAQALRGGHQSLSVFVCGPITMQNDVRNAVAAENLDIVRSSRVNGVYLYSEHFSWA
jgi:ferredoxin-NADP reductase